ncbi:putative beta-lactamase fold-containing exonuclease [Encephalitozoon romaleae SJ-2008]|uniref:Endoribonuclease YSH1 n=1 Tax=Encephalitozoon romaleae (strain SJ-2008) TaxID=1178016 RepID=I7APT9_ENCRO|nr:putative beta-lactamase fold-containing exonuclease [Encephalitozoon romaleae SJ-2008]AFN83894.1 putative beta-lactamase fold-containing exonuclease [Encephalitozoon romaleae SJ-2008]
MFSNEKIKIMPLGAGNEVGRSCVIVECGGRTIMLDCGVHPAYTGVASLPFLDLVDLSKIDAIFITHFHLDHAAALPFLTEKTSFKGKVYMTHPTKAILKWLLNDYIRLINAASDADFYTESDLIKCYDRIIPIDYHQEVNVKGIKVKALNAGHVLGAAMFLIEIEKSKVLYTGDFSREEDRHLKAAESPGCKIDGLITESTYGVQCHLPRAEREGRFTSIVQNVVQRGGRCLLPVFALGRAQELLLILEEHWNSNTSLQKIPIYYASALAKRCMGVYQTYIGMMNERIQKLSLVRNPFAFKYVKNLKGIDSFDDEGPCVIMASPGMLQSGLSRDLFERWCSDSKNAVIIPGYCVDGTLAKEILSEPKEIEALNGKKLRLNMSVEYISFSAHVDFTQNSQFIEECQPKHLFFVHGEMNEMQRLRNVIQQRNEKKGIEMILYTLRNGEEAEFDLVKDNEAKIFTNVEGEFEGIIVGTEDDIRIYKRDELIESKYKEMNIYERQRIPYNSTAVLLKQVLMDGFSELVEVESGFMIGNVHVKLDGQEVVLEWKSSYADDVLAISISKMISGIGLKTKSVKLSKMGKEELLISVLKNYFVIEKDGDIVKVKNGSKEAYISRDGVTGDSSVVDKIDECMRKIKVIYSEV